MLETVVADFQSDYVPPRLIVAIPGYPIVNLNRDFRTAVIEHVIELLFVLL